MPAESVGSVDWFGRHFILLVTKSKRRGENEDRHEREQPTQNLVGDKNNKCGLLSRPYADNSQYTCDYASCDKIQCNGYATGVKMNRGCYE